MDITEQLEEAKTKRQELVNQFNARGQQLNAITEERNAILQDILRFDGEVRVLERLSKNGTKPEK